MVPEKMIKIDTSNIPIAMSRMFFLANIYKKMQLKPSR